MRATVTSVEYYLQRPEKLGELKSEAKKAFWGARSWHPVVKMNWMAGIASDGAGLITFPDGSTMPYQVRDRVDKSA